MYDNDRFGVFFALRLVGGSRPPAEIGSPALQVSRIMRTTDGYTTTSRFLAKGILVWLIMN